MATLQEQLDEFTDHGETKTRRSFNWRQYANNDWLGPVAAVAFVVLVVLIHHFFGDLVHPMQHDWARWVWSIVLATGVMILLGVIVEWVKTRE